MLRIQKKIKIKNLREIGVDYISIQSTSQNDAEFISRSLLKTRNPLVIQWDHEREDDPIGYLKAKLVSN